MDGNVEHRSHLLTISLGFANTVKRNTDCLLYISNSALYGEQRLSVLYPITADSLTIATE